MRRTTAAGLLVVGALALGGAGYYHKTRFSNSAIWDRQRPLVEMTFRRDPAQKAKAFKALRTGLKRISRDDVKQRCVFETDFAALTKNKGNADAAKRSIEVRSFEPYEECNADNRLLHTGTRWFTVVGLAAVIPALISLIGSAFRRKRNNVPE